MDGKIAQAVEQEMNTHMGNQSNEQKLVDKEILNRLNGVESTLDEKINAKIKAANEVFKTDVDEKIKEGITNAVSAQDAYINSSYFRIENAFEKKITEQSDKLQGVDTGILERLDLIESNAAAAGVTHEPSSESVGGSGGKLPTRKETRNRGGLFDGSKVEAKVKTGKFKPPGKELTTDMEESITDPLDDDPTSSSFQRPTTMLAYLSKQFGP